MCPAFHVPLCIPWLLHCTNTARPRVPQPPAAALYLRALRLCEKHHWGFSLPRWQEEKKQQQKITHQHWEVVVRCLVLRSYLHVKLQLRNSNGTSSATPSRYHSRLQISASRQSNKVIFRFNFRFIFSLQMYQQLNFSLFTQMETFQQAFSKDMLDTTTN